MSSDGGEVAIRFTSQQQEKLWGDIARTVSALSDLQGKGEEMAATTGKASASLRRFAESVKAAQSTPDSRLADEMAKLDAATKANLLTQEQFAAASTAAHERYQAEVNQSATEAEAFARAQRSEEVNAQLREQIKLVRERGAELTASRAASEAAAEQERRDLERVESEWDRYAAGVKDAIRTPVQAYHAKLEKLSEAHVRGKLTIDEYHAAAKKAFDSYKRGADGAEKSQQSLSTSAVVGGTLIANAYMKAGQVLTDVFRRAAAESDRFKEKAREAGDEYGELAQLQANTPELVAQADQLVASGSVKSFAEGKAAIFAAESAGAQQSLPDLANLAKFGAIRDIPDVIRSAETMRSTMGAEVGSPVELLAKALAAARSSITTAERVQIAASKSGTSGRELGISADESLAAASVIANAKGSPDTGGERLAALFRGLKMQDGMQGKTLPEMIQAVQAKGMGFEERQKFLGGSEADEAFSVLENKLGMLSRAIDDVAKANGAETLRAIASDAASVTRVAAAADNRASRGDLDVAGIDIGVRELQFEAIVNRRKAENIRTEDERLRARMEANRGVAAPWNQQGSDRWTMGTAALDNAVLDMLSEMSKSFPSLRGLLQESAEANRDTARAAAAATAALAKAASKTDRAGPARREAAAAHGGG